jgi:hypothetical protein
MRQLCDLVGQSWSATNAENPVDDQIAGQLGDRIIEVDYAAAGSDQCGATGGMGCAEASHGGHPYATTGQPNPGEQCVAAVVARTDHDHHVAPVSTAGGGPQQVGGTGGNGSRGPLHQSVHALARRWLAPRYGGSPRRGTRA